MTNNPLWRTRSPYNDNVYIWIHCNIMAKESDKVKSEVLSLFFHDGLNVQCIDYDNRESNVLN